MPAETPILPDGPQRTVIRPDAPEYLIEPEAEALGETPGGLPLPAVIHRDRLVAGGATYRLCQGRNLACPALELDAALEPAEALAGVVELVDALAPDARSLLAATRCQSGRGRPPRGAATISRVRAAELAGGTPATIAEAQAALADPERVQRVWCRSGPAAAQAGPAGAGESASADRSPPAPKTRRSRAPSSAGSPRSARARADGRGVPARTPTPDPARTAITSGGTGQQGSTGGLAGQPVDTEVLLRLTDLLRQQCRSMIEYVHEAFKCVRQTVETTRATVGLVDEAVALNRELKGQLDQVLLHLGTDSETLDELDILDVLNPTTRILH